MKSSRTKSVQQDKDSWTSLGMEPSLLKRIHRLAKLHYRSDVAEVRSLVEKGEKEAKIFEDELS